MSDVIDVNRIDNKGVNLLYTAFFFRSCLDLQESTKRINRRKARGLEPNWRDIVMQDDCIRYFRSDRFGRICSVDPEVIITKCLAGKFNTHYSMRWI